MKTPSKNTIYPSDILELRELIQGMLGKNRPLPVSAFSNLLDGKASEILKHWEDTAALTLNSKREITSLS